MDHHLSNVLITLHNPSSAFHRHELRAPVVTPAKLAMVILAKIAFRYFLPSLIINKNQFLKFYTLQHPQFLYIPTLSICCYSKYYIPILIVAAPISNPKQQQGSVRLVA